MRHALTSLTRNLVAGLRLALFLPVTRLAFRIDLAQLVLLFVFSALIDVGGDWLRAGDDREFSLLGFGTDAMAITGTASASARCRQTSARIAETSSSNAPE